MMLKQATPSRSLKTRGFKVRHALKICLLLAISIWLLYQVKQRSHFKSDFSDLSSEKIMLENPVIKFGRKDLNPVLRDHDFESSKKVEKEDETEIDDAKVEEINAMEGQGGGDDEIDGNDQERAEEEEEEEDSDSELEDLIDVEDQEKEEATIVEEETVSSQTKEQSADYDVSTRNEDETDSLRKVKEDESFSEKKNIQIGDSITRDADSSERV